MSHGIEPHDSHDRLLVASLAGGDLAGPELETATALVRDCADCRQLHDDLLSLARATAALPAAVRPREFTISPEQAARLRPRGLRGLVAAFAAPRMAFTRSLGVGLTTLGLAGLLFSALPSMSLSIGSGAAGASIAPEAMSASDGAAGEYVGPAQAGTDESATPVEDHNIRTNSYASGAPGLLPAASAAAATASGSGDGVAQARPTQRDAAATAEGDTGTDELFATVDADAQTPSLLILLSIGLVIAGLAILVARRLAARVAAG